MAEQRYRAVLAVIADGFGVSEAASMVGGSWQTMHAWGSTTAVAVKAPLCSVMPGVSR